MKNNRGITLVALIITVVIMLILAAIAIGSLTGDGLFNKTRDAVGEYENASTKEADQMQALMNEIDKYLTGGNGGEGTETDTTAPTNVTIESTNVEETTFTLTATGTDGESGIAKYEFYINGVLEKTVETVAGTATYNVSGKTAGTPYTCKVRVYNNAGNYEDSSEIIVTTKTAAPTIADMVQVGDFVNYDAGVWTEADFNKITSSLGSPTVNKSTALPTTQGQFGGFTVGQSRNSNSTAFRDYSGKTWTPKYSGWRVWDIDESTGEVTLISAGHPETYCSYQYYALEGKQILSDRDYSMYKNGHDYVDKVEVLTKEEFDRWYKKYIDSSVDDTVLVDSFPAASEKPLITVAENGSYYWFASMSTPYSLYYIVPEQRYVNSTGNGSHEQNGVRLLVSLTSGVHVEEAGETGGVSTWDIVEN